MGKLSEQLGELSDRVADAGEEDERRREGIQEKLEASIGRSTADAKARQAAFKAKVEQRQAAAAFQMGRTPRGLSA